MQRPLIDAEGAPARPAPPVLTVAAFVSAARLAVERHFGNLWVAGEISNLYRAGSGHVYFTLKDADAQIKCTLWRSKAQLVAFALRDGLAVEVRATPSIYEPRGEFQLVVDAVRQAGAGALYERFLRLKAKLDALGWFDGSRKRALPRFPRRVGVVTSPRGAAVSDVITTLRRRWPALRVVVYPTAVQGESAAFDIARAIQLANRRGEVDVLIVCRGGGSLEDLWAFNEEAVARAIVESALPVVSGVGHETDFTIADFVADVRAPTPTGAAQLVAPDRSEFCHRAGELGRRVARAGNHVLGTRAQRLDHASRRLVHPAARLADQRDLLVQCARRLARCWSHQLASRDARIASLQLRFARVLRAPPAASLRVQRLEERLLRAGRERTLSPMQRLQALASNLAHLNPTAVLERGYAIVTSRDGDIVVDSAALAAGDDVTLTLGRGEADATIRSRR